MTIPAFIPKDQIEPGRVYRGYEARSDGLHHWTQTLTPGHLINGDLRVKDIRVPMTKNWGVEPSRKRTPQERTESLASRLAYHFDRYGLSASLVSELQAVAWKAGNPLTSEECQALAAAKLQEAETAWNDQQRKSVVRTDPHVIDGPEQIKSEKQHPGRTTFTSAGVINSPTGRGARSESPSSREG